ncbi:MAG: RNA polymerase sigma-70 factor [Bacteroidetes bacterium]|nr:RNA polymerase sigma-70 factor [Bacteroidota bacterium]
MIIEEDISRDLKQNNKEAFEYVFDSYFNALCSFGCKYLKDLSTTEDIVQEVFVAFWGNRKNFSHINAIKSFLYTSVRNKCLNQLKHQIVVQKHETDLTYQLESDSHFSEHVIEEETFNRLYAEINNLPDACQKIMLLALNGSKNQEIADKLEITVNTVKTQKKIAYSKLKDQLGPVLSAVLLML